MVADLCTCRAIYKCLPVFLLIFDGEVMKYASSPATNGSVELYLWAHRL